MAHFGQALEAELDSVEGKNGREIKRKRERIMQKWLDLPRKFRSPIGTKKHIDGEADIEQQFSTKGDVVF